MSKGNEEIQESGEKDFFISIRTMNKRLQARMSEINECMENTLGIYMEAEDSSDKKTESTRRYIQDIKATYDGLTAPSKGKNVFFRVARKIPLPSAMPVIRLRTLALEKGHIAKQQIISSTAQRKKYADVSNYAFRKEEPYLHGGFLSSGSWSVDFNLLATQNSEFTWNTVLEYSERECQTWWAEKRLSGQPGSPAWLDLKTLCKCVVFILDEVTSEYLARFPSVKLLSSIAEEARMIAVGLVALHSRHPHQDHGVSRLLGLTVPVVFSLWKITDRAKKISRDTEAVKELAASILSTALSELGNMLREIRELASEFGAAVLAHPYLMASRTDKTSSHYIPKPMVSQLFEPDPTGLSEEATKIILDSGLMQCTDLASARNNIQRLESETAAKMIVADEDDSEFKFDLSENIGLARIDVELEPVMLLGSGSHYTVCSHRSKDGSELYAVKTPKKKTRAGANVIKRESFIWIKLKHDNILPLIGYWADPQDALPSLVTSACLDGSLEHYLREHGHEPERSRLSFLRDIVSGLMYMHSEGVAHGDLRASNVLVQRVTTGDSRAVLCDFGISDVVTEVEERLYERSDDQRTRDNWLAPELLFAPDDTIVRVSKEGDVYAFGCVVLEVMFGRKPYASYPPSEVKEAKQGGCPPAKKSEMNDTYWSIASKCWEYEKDQRPTSSLVLSRLGNLCNYS